jgi:hypothetical protein
MFDNNGVFVNFNEGEDNPSGRHKTSDARVGLFNTPPEYLRPVTAGGTPPAGDSGKSITPRMKEDRKKRKTRADRLHFAKFC